MQEPQGNNKAMTFAALRGAVAAYLVYLGYQIITNQDTTMSRTMSWVLGCAMFLTALGVAAYTVYRLRIDTSQAKQPQGDDTHEE